MTHPNSTTNSNSFDVIIVGTGPAGIFTALELIKSENRPNKILMLEAGNSISNRMKNRLDGKNEVMQGWGGAGAFSDGKLTLTAEIGGRLSEYIPRSELNKYLSDLEDIYIKYGASKNRILTGESPEILKYRKKAAANGMNLIPYRLMHIGTDKCAEVVKEMYSDLVDSKIVDINFNETAKTILVENNSISGILTDKGKYSCKYVVVATGRSGAAWIRSEAKRLNVPVVNNPVDIGVRVEIPAEISSQLTDLLYEFKCHYYSPTFEQECRTFCVCPNGIVTEEVVYDPDTREKWITVNGHSYADNDKGTENTNFAILVSSEFTEPFDDPLAYGRSISKLANLLSKGNVVVQRLTDLKRGRRSTQSRIKRLPIEPTFKKAIPGDLSFVLPYRHLCSILEMITALDNLIPGINSNNTILYGVETKFYSSKIRVDQNLQTCIDGLYAIGDGGGITRSLAQASVSGIIAGQAILNQK